jgi:hypothetical protein
MQIRPDRKGSDDQLLEMVLCPTFSLQTVADANNMTLTQLAAWAAKDHIKQALAAMRQIHRARAAVVAAEAVTTALSTLDAMVKAHENEERNQLPAQNPEAQKVRARTRETIRKACHQLLGAARYVAPGFRPEHRAPARSDQRPTSETTATAPSSPEPAPEPRPPAHVVMHPDAPIAGAPTATSKLLAAAGAAPPPPFATPQQRTPPDSPSPALNPAITLR